MSRMIRVASGHNLCITKLPSNKVPAGLQSKEVFSDFYVVQNFDTEGYVFFYVGKGHVNAPGEIVVWYGQSGKLWSGFGKTFKDAIEGAQRDGWMYA